MVGTLASPSSPRHKSFAQHLLEIEQEAAKAAKAKIFFRVIKNACNTCKKNFAKEI